MESKISKDEKLEAEGLIMWERSRLKGVWVVQRVRLGNLGWYMSAISDSTHPLTQ